MNTNNLNTASRSKTNFLYSFSLLPKEKRDAIKIVYAFCRETDDIVDNSERSIQEKEIHIKQWREELTKSFKNSSDNSLLIELNNIVRKYNIPEEPFYELIDGMEQDIKVLRYNDFKSLSEYCYKVASTVGLMSIEIFGYKTKYAREYAINLGIAMQLTNIIRDVKQDALNGRIYIPLEDMSRNDYKESDLMKSSYNDQFIELMKHQCKRAKEYYERAEQNFMTEDKKLLFPAKIMQSTYYDILKKVENMNYNIFDKRIKISKFRKVYLALGIFFKYNIAFR